MRWLMGWISIGFALFVPSLASDVCHVLLFCVSNVFLHCLTPGVVILRNVLTLWSHIDRSSSNIVSFTNVSVVDIGMVCRPGILFQLTAKMVGWDTSTLHPSDAIEPSEMLLTVITSMIPPGYVEDAPEASQVKGVELRFLPGVGSPDWTTKCELRMHTW